MNMSGNDQRYQWTNKNCGGQFKFVAEKQCEISMPLCEGENIDSVQHVEDHMKNESHEKIELANAQFENSEAKM